MSYKEWRAWYLTERKKIIGNVSLSQDEKEIAITKLLKSLYCNAPI